ncbi:uncharacterized protein [Prorops nasuta]|uniref:uncharacterized protein n=1 Tax=Prorops nasuta TaxID=863751 RepID=UPI0034CE017A
MNAYPDLLSSNKRNKDDKENNSQQNYILSDSENNSGDGSNNENRNYGDIIQNSSEYLNKNNEDLSKIVEKQLNTIRKLKNELKMTKGKLRKYERNRAQEERGRIGVFFNTDQLDYLKRRKIRGSSWSEDTITKALKLYMACGTTGYNEIRKQNLPYPSIRTLQYHIQSVKLKAGIFEEVFHLLELKIKTFAPNKKHAVLIFDEMAIKPGLQFDSSLSTIVGYSTLKSNNQENGTELANHALVYMIAGIFISTVITDMGPNNQSLWKKLNIVAGKYSKINNYIHHPCLPEKKLFFMSDSVHVFKNLAIALTKNYKFILDNSIVKKYNLPSNEISIEPIKKIYEMDKKDVIKLCPRLKENVINPSHFDKMNAKLSISLINYDVSSAISYCIAEEKLDKKYRTTSWFINTMYKWFQIMTSRYFNLALTLTNEDKYNEATDVLKSIDNLMCKLTINNKWMPFQSGIRLWLRSVITASTVHL